MVKCILCLEYPTIPGPKFLDIFSEDGLRLGISAIINKHFWIKTYRNGDEKQQVCMTCWEVVRDFHILYERVEEAHKHLGAVHTIDILDDPLPQQDVVMLKSEDTPVPMMLQDPIMGHSSMGNNLFDPEVKVEVNDLDLLPQIEILETEHDMSSMGGVAGDVDDNNEDVKSRRTRIASARGESPKPTTAAKRIKKESSPALDKEMDDDDGDVFGDSAHVYHDSSDEDSDKPLLPPPSLDVPQEEDNKEKEVARPRRGRPRKSEAEKAAAKAASQATKKTPIARKRNSKKSLAATVKNEGGESEEPSCSTSATTTHIKTEGEVSEDQQSRDKPSTADPSNEPFDIPDFTNDNEDDDDDPEYGDNDNDFVAKDSDESSNSESEDENENDSDASDWVADKVKSEKFAVILKKERNTPKMYKKREKTASEPKRMSKEDIAARQAQQAEYDNIITKFFEKLRCPKCELMVHTFSEMRAHFRLDHNDDHGFVECCGRRFATRKFLAEHIMVHYNPEHFKCKTCNKICRDSTQLEAHEQTHLPNPPESKYKKTFQCEKCSKTFSSKASFEHHMVAKHVPREEFKFECPECKKKWPSKAKLQKHMTSHDISKQKICDQCGKTFRCNTSMRKHVEAEHSEIKPEPQQCTICNTWYRNLSGLRTHQKFMHEIVGGENRCHICNKVSSNYRALRRHIYLNHECERKYKCHMCEKAFKREQDLREHISVHTGEALYTCPNCPMTFSSSANMYKHRQRLHKAEYAAHKQQPLAVNIIKQAKSMPNTIRTKRRMPTTTTADTAQNSNNTAITDSSASASAVAAAVAASSSSPVILPSTTLNSAAAFVNNHLIPPHFLVGSHFPTKMSE
ncbi:zinc finger protein 37 isoform X3 [Musca domestica]|uniref:Zinc finger protein 37 isoform X1 n=1 Tax=Musca domestica TaxID=7370 RepID=A0A1I8MZQ3_MUSDO|nr:zinc finger protein 37 isoform X3 [Musca domestica]